MVDTQLNGHRTGESSLVSVQPVGDPQRQHKGRPSPLQRRKQRLTQQLQGVPIISRSVGHGLTHRQPPVLPSPLRIGRPFASPPAAIEMIDLCKTFGAFRAVDHLSLVVQQGEVFGLLGPNGSGKTTTINLICGLSDPTSGGIQVMGYDIPRQKRHMYQILGAVHQETALYDELSAWDNMMFHAKLYGVPAAARDTRITALLQLVGLLDKKGGCVEPFSGGMKRRLAIARALLHDPQLICLDEPTLGVDPQARSAIWEYIRKLRRQGKTVLITTNYMEEAQALCDRLAIIDQGRLIALDTPDRLRQAYGGSVIELEAAITSTTLDKIRALDGVEDVKQNGMHLTITTRGSNHIIPQIIELVSQEGELRDLAVYKPPLDAIFLQLTGTALRD